MHTVNTLPEFAALSDEEIDKALDALDAEPKDSSALDVHPILTEIERLIQAYSDRFEELVDEQGGIPEDLLSFEPDKPIERVAYDIFSDALHDTLQEEDDE